MRFFIVYIIRYIFSVTLCLLMTFFVIACEEKQCLYRPDYLSVFSTQLPSDTLFGENVKVPLLMPHEIESIDSILIILDRQSGSYINVINVETDSLLGSFGTSGRAKHEFQDFPKYISWSEMADGELLIICPDLVKNVNKVINIDQSIKNGCCMVECEYRQETSIASYRTFYMNDNCKITRQDITYEDPRDNIFFPPYFIIENGSNSYLLNTYPFVVDNKMASIVLSVYSDILKVSPDHSKLLQVLSYLDIFNVIDIQKKSVSGFIKDGSYGFELFQEIHTMDEAIKRIRLYNSDVCVTDNYIFILQDGRTVEEIECEQGEIYCSTLCVFSWDGVLKTSYYLDRELLRIAYNERYNVLYGLDKDGEIFKYNMNECL